MHIRANETGGVVGTLSEGMGVILSKVYKMTNVF